MIHLRKYHSLASVMQAWENLWGNNPNATVYQSPAYARMIAKHILPYKIILRQNPEFFLFLEDDAPIMILPLFHDWFGHDYTLFGYKTGCGYLDAIYAEDMTLEKMGECFSVFSDAHPNAKISCCHIRQESLLGQYLSQSAKDRQFTPCVVISLPNDFEEYSASLSKNTRQNLRTAYNRLQKDEKTFELQVVDHHAMSRNLRHKLLKIYADRQVKHYRKAGGYLYRLFIRYIDVGTILHKEFPEVKSFVLRIDGQIAGYFDALYKDCEVVIPRLAIDDTFSRYSPGVLLLNESIRYFYDSTAIRTIDLTHGNEQYKVAMGGTIQQCLKGTLLV
ncbi:MAG: GNAT family N-acetyltransferase [Oscillospiraceae bacterium]|nr:GNAT family N-acetyltransferase [Oscillospiraceae bacterium]